MDAVKLEATTVHLIHNYLDYINIEEFIDQTIDQISYDSIAKLFKRKNFFRLFTLIKKYNTVDQKDSNLRLF